MTDQKNPKPSVGGDYISAEIGDNAHQVAVGKDIRQQQQIGASQVTPEDWKQVESLFNDLKAQIAKEAPPEQKDAALERVDELKAELKNPKPELSTFDYVRNWFSRNLPSLLGAVTSVVVNPIVGKVVEAAGTIAASEIRKHFGAE